VGDGAVLAMAGRLRTGRRRILRRRRRSLCTGHLGAGRSACIIRTLTEDVAGFLGTGTEDHFAQPVDRGILGLQLGLDPRQGIDHVGEERVILGAQERAGTREGGSHFLHAHFQALWLRACLPSLLLVTGHAAINKRSRKSRHSGKPSTSFKLRFARWVRSSLPRPCVWPRYIQFGARLQVPRQRGRSMKVSAKYTGWT